MATSRQLLLEALRGRLRAIRTSDGFQTDVGASDDTLIIGESVELGPDDPAVAIAMVVGDEEPQRNGENVFSELPIEFQALVRVSNDGFSAAYLAAEALVSDIKRALELSDRSVGGLVRPRLERGVVRTVPRESGSQTVGVGITYLAPRVEAWGNP